MISSLSNDRVKKWMKLYIKKYRQDNYLILDSDICLKAYQNGFLDTLIYVGAKPFDFDNAFEVSAEVMDKLTKGKMTTYIGIGKKKELAISKKVERILLSDELQDPLNIGKIINCAYLFGFDVIYLSKNCADVFSEKSVLQSGGAIFKMPLYYVDLEDIILKLQNEGFKVYATGLRRDNYELADVKAESKMAFILGNEGSGVREKIMDMSDGIIKIDMRNIDSLNVAMAASIIMHRFSKEF